MIRIDGSLISFGWDVFYADHPDVSVARVDGYPVPRVGDELEIESDTARELVLVNRVHWVLLAGRRINIHVFVAPKVFKA